MRTVGVRELKANASELLRLVNEEGEIVEVTRHGQVIARLVPAHTTIADRDSNGAWSDLRSLIGRISAQWPQGVSAEDAINDVRRDL